MNPNVLRKKIKAIYSNAVDQKDRAFQEGRRINPIVRELKQAEQALMNSLDDKNLNNLEIKDIGDIQDLLVGVQEQAERLQKRYEKKSISQAEYDESLEVSTNDYLQSVETFTKSGGKGFYDIAINITSKYHFTRERFTEEVAKLQEQGLDIQLFSEETFDLENCHGRDCYVMPSSAYEAFKAALLKVDELTFDGNYKYHAQQSVSAYFIMPYLKDYGQTMEKAQGLLERDKKSWRVESAFTSMGYFRAEINGMGVRGQDNMQEVVRGSIGCVDLYQNFKDHINGFMPNPYIYDEDELEILGKTGEVHMNVVDDLKIEAFRLEKDVALER